jgi:hypothetical protein
MSRVRLDAKSITSWEVFSSDRVNFSGDWFPPLPLLLPTLVKLSSKSNEAEGEWLPY